MAECDLQEAKHYWVCKFCLERTLTLLTVKIHIYTILPTHFPFYKFSKILELALPIGFIALLVLIKSSVEDTAGFAPELVKAEFPDTNDATLMFSYSDYVTAMQVNRTCKAIDDDDFEISGMPFRTFNWQVPFVKCDRRLCTENGQDARCQYSALGVAPKNALDTIGKERAEAFRNYVHDRFPVLSNTTRLPFGFDFVQIFDSEQDLENYVQADDYRMSTDERPTLGLAVVWDGTDDGTDSYTYTIRVNGTGFNSPEEQTQPGVSTIPPTDQNFEHFAKDDDSCPVIPGSPDVGAKAGSCTRRYMLNGVLPTQRLIHDFIFEDSKAKDAGYFVAEHGVRFAPFPSKEYVSEGFYAAVAGETFHIIWQQSTTLSGLFLNFCYLFQRHSLGTFVGDTGYLISSGIHDEIHCTRKAESTKGTHEDDGNSRKRHWFGMVHFVPSLSHLYGIGMRSRHQGVLCKGCH